MDHFPSAPIRPSGMSMSAGFGTYQSGDYVMYALIDSGSNRHYLCTKDFFIQKEPSNLVITGLGEHSEYAKSCGLWAGTLTYQNGNIFNFEAFGTYVPSNKISLLS
eukprot:172968-Rhodomonas_salina.1